MRESPILERLSSQEAALTHLEETRFGQDPACPWCLRKSIGRHTSGDRAQARWQCHQCSRTFSATARTLFCGTHMPLMTWYRVIWIMLSAEKSPGACEIARATGVRRATVWNMMQRIRLTMMVDRTQAALLRKLVGISVKPRARKRAARS